MSFKLGVGSCELLYSEVLVDLLDESTELLGFARGFHARAGEVAELVAERRIALGVGGEYHLSAERIAHRPVSRAPEGLGLQLHLTGEVVHQDAEKHRDAAFAAAGIVRYEVSNFSRPGFECRHNLAVWRGEDYVGIGEGAHGREGLSRTVGLASGYERRAVAAEEDAVERALLSLRTASGLDLDFAAKRWPILAPRIPSWLKTLSSLENEGVLRETSPRVFAPTSRGFEVCDAVMAALL